MLFVHWYCLLGRLGGLQCSTTPSPNDAAPRGQIPGTCMESTQNPSVPAPHQQATPPTLAKGIRNDARPSGRRGSLIQTDTIPPPPHTQKGSPLHHAVAMNSNKELHSLPRAVKRDYHLPDLLFGALDDQQSQSIKLVVASSVHIFCHAPPPSPRRHSERRCYGGGMVRVLGGSAAMGIDTIGVFKPSLGHQIKNTRSKGKQ